MALFKELVTYSYIVTMEAYAGQTVVFVADTESEGVATVLTKIQSRQGPPVPIEYRMHQRAARWLVYDVVVEGAGLIHRMRTRVGELKGGAGTVAFTRPAAPGPFGGGSP